MLTIIPVPNNLMTPPFRSRSDRTLDAAGGKDLRGNRARTVIYKSLQNRIA